jgi:hypothetical protein
LNPAQSRYSTSLHLEKHVEKDLEKHLSREYCQELYTIQSIQPDNQSFLTGTIDQSEKSDLGNQPIKRLRLDWIGC